MLREVRKHGFWWVTIDLVIWYDYNSAGCEVLGPLFRMENISKRQNKSAPQIVTLDCGFHFVGIKLEVEANIAEVTMPCKMG